MTTPIFTIGHSTHPINDFLHILEAHGIERVVDIRTLRGSRRHPQFHETALRRALVAKGLSYLPLPELGGLRRSGPGSLNLGWRNAGLRGYADHMQTPEFERGLAKLFAAANCRLAMMCAEAVPWRCHRSLVADALWVRTIAVSHILDAATVVPHCLTPFASVEGRSISYPAAGS